MSNYIDLNANNPDELCRVAKALSSPVRIRILKLLYDQSYHVNEIAEKLALPPSSTGLHIRALEEAGLIRCEQRPGERGAAKLCSRTGDLVTIRLYSLLDQPCHMKTVDMPIGAFTDCEIHPTCGLGTSEGVIGSEDNAESFYLPDRVNAQILWTSAGYMEYRFPNPVPPGSKAKKLTLSLEICSEAPNYREDWKSDITVWFNGAECGTWTCPGDFGARRGRLTPDWIPQGSTQYGILVSWTMGETSNEINGTKVAGASLSEARIEDSPYITVRIGNKPDAVHIGGFNIFGEQCGDYSQGIQLTAEY